MLPAELQAGAAADLRTVLADTSLAQPLIDAYPRDLALRRAGAEALRNLPPDLLNRFVSLVKIGVPEPTAKPSG